MRPKSVGSTPTAGSTTTIYTVPTGYYAEWNLSYIFNNTGSTKSFTLEWYDASSATTYTVFSAGVNSKEYIKLDGGAYVVLEEGDQVKATPESGSTFTIICTFVEKGDKRS